MKIARRLIYSLTLIFVSIVMSCTSENNSDTTIVESFFNSKALALYDGSFLLNQCGVDRGADIISLSIKQVGDNEIILEDFDGISVNEKFIISDQNKIRYIGDDFSVYGSIQENNVIFDVTYLDNTYCSISFSLRDLFSFSGDYELYSSETNEKLNFSTGNLINGTVILTLLNGERLTEFFSIDYDVVNIEIENISIIGKIENGTPVFSATVEGTEFYTPVDLPRRLSLKASNDKFVSSENGLTEMFANRNTSRSWETFEVIQVGNQRIALKANNGKFVSSENGRFGMRANRENIGSWEMFEIIKLTENTIALKANNGKFVSSENGLKGMISNRNAIGEWEKFAVIEK